MVTIAEFHPCQLYLLAFGCVNTHTRFTSLCSNYPKGLGINSGSQLTISPTLNTNLGPWESIGASDGTGRLSRYCSWHCWKFTMPRNQWSQWWEKKGTIQTSASNRSVWTSNAECFQLRSVSGSFRLSDHGKGLTSRNCFMRLSARILKQWVWYKMTQGHVLGRMSFSGPSARSSRMAIKVSMTSSCIHCVQQRVRRAFGSTSCPL